MQPESRNAQRLTDRYLEWLERWNPTMEEVDKFFTVTLPMIAEEILAPYAACTLSEYQDGTGTGTTVYFATGGWSACEDLIHAITSNLFLNIRWYQSRVGGAYWFRIPREEREA